MTSFTFPSGITKISSFGGRNSRPLPSLEKITYNTANATIENHEILGDVPDFELTIGSAVEHLPKNFSSIAKHTSNIYIEPNSAFSVEEGAFEGAGKPFSEMSGKMYSDANGILYTYDTENYTATLVYCPPGISDVTIPATITVNEMSYHVKAVASKALKCAENLTRLTFENPTAIQSLDTYALANCVSLVSVNGKTTVEDAEALFTNAEKGYGVFYNTGLIGAEDSSNMNGKQSLKISSNGTTELNLTVTSDGGSMKWSANDETDETSGRYRLLTGDTLKVVASVSNGENTDKFAYRVYYRLTEEEGSCSIEVGNTYTFNGQTAVCYATEDPNTVYLEFSPTVGATVSIPVNVLHYKKY